MSELLTASEFCERARITRRTLGRWLAEPDLVKQLGAFRQRGRGGGEWRIPAAALEIIQVDDTIRKLTDGRASRGTVEARRCEGTKHDSTPCSAPAQQGSRFCRWHQDQAEACDD